MRSSNRVRIEAAPVELPRFVYHRISPAFFLAPCVLLSVLGAVIVCISVFTGLCAPNWLLALNCRQVPGKPICLGKK